MKFTVRVISMALLVLSASGVASCLQANHHGVPANSNADAIAEEDRFGNFTQPKPAGLEMFTEPTHRAHGARTAMAAGPYSARWMMIFCTSEVPS